MAVCSGWVAEDLDIALRLRRFGRSAEVSPFGRPALTKAECVERGHRGPRSPPEKWLAGANGT